MDSLTLRSTSPNQDLIFNYSCGFSQEWNLKPVIRNDLVSNNGVICLKGPCHPLKEGKVKVLVTQSCPTPWDPMDWSPPGSSVHGIFQARIREWVAISFSRGSFWTKDQTHISWNVRQILYHWATRKAKILLKTHVCMLFHLILTLSHQGFCELFHRIAVTETPSQTSSVQGHWGFCYCSSMK